jgi:L-asparaginase
MSDLPRVLMIFTGGTISMKVVPGRGAVPASGGREILDHVPELAALARITCEDFARLPGPHWSPERMFELARYLDERLAGDVFAGAVVTHGTDTIEETAYLLDLVLRTDLPVVPGNLAASVRAVIGPRGGWDGVGVMMAGTLHLARQVAKTHTDALDAFTSQGGRPGPRERIATRAVEPRVELVAAYAGADAKFLRHAVAQGARGIVIAAMGRGNVPPAMLPGVREAVEAGVAVVVASRCGRGRTAPSYGYDGGGVTLRDAGAIFSGEQSGPKARVKLMVLLGAGASMASIRESFERT